MIESWDEVVYRVDPYIRPEPKRPGMGIGWGWLLAIACAVLFWSIAAAFLFGWPW